MAVETNSVVGIVAGMNPLEYSASSPYTLFLFQAVFIILMCQLLHYPLSKLQQPRVIAEVVTGILLGPSVLGQSSKFTETCFPTASVPGLTLMANIGIILFLFIIGLEVDLGFIASNVRVACTVGLINMAVPFALGCGIAKGLYNEYRVDDPDLEKIDFTTYMVFIAVAMCITAFPVLARILTELNLIGDRVGNIVLAAGIANDLTGWILLALAVTLANASNSVNTVYILLLTLAWFLFLAYPVRLALKFYLKKFTNDLTTGVPSQLSMLLVLMIVFISAFFTDIIGVHPIFGAFMVGVIVPRDKGYVIRITEKIEDVVHILLIPIYFALAGLNVNLGLLNHGIDWAYTIGIILLALFGKVAGGFVAAKLNKLLWRESLAVGVLMSCKGIVEIVVLNVGLNAGIISQRVYSMFIVMALITTFLTTPLTLLVYPASYRERVAQFLNGDTNWDGSPNDVAESLTNNKYVDNNLVSLNQIDIDNLNEFKFSRIILLLQKIDTISYMMGFIQSLALESFYPEIKAVHLREFTSRTYHLLEASSKREYEIPSPDMDSSDQNNSSAILAIVKVFSEMLGISFSSKSILASSKHHITSINDQISSSKDLLLCASKSTDVFNSLNVDDDENQDYLSMRLLPSCKANYGLLLIGDENRSAISRSADDTIVSQKIYHEDNLEANKTLLASGSIHLLLNHSDILTNTDLLSLATAYQLCKSVSSITIYIRSTSAGVPAFEEKIKTYYGSHSNSPLLNFIYFNKNSSLEEYLDKEKQSLGNELVIVPYEHGLKEAIINDSLKRLVAMSVEESFNILVMKTPEN